MTIEKIVLAINPETGKEDYFHCSGAKPDDSRRGYLIDTYSTLHEYQSYTLDQLEIQKRYVRYE